MEFHNITYVYHRKMEERDRRRWDTADEDKDGHLNKFEFKHFLHPEEADHMRDVVISETVDDIDKDGDGFLPWVFLVELFINYKALK